MGEAGFDDWDADFLEQLIQVEEIALSSRPTPSHQLHPLPGPSISPPRRPSPPKEQPPLPPYEGDSHGTICYSPPRELSQRVSKSKASDCSPSGIDNCFTSSFRHSRHSGNARDVEVKRLKRELGYVSKELSDLQRECLEIRRDRDIKEEQIKSLSSHIDAKETEALFLSGTSGQNGRKRTVHIQGYSEISRQCPNESYTNDQNTSHVDLDRRSCKTVGVQTDKVETSSHLTEDKYTQHAPSENLLAIWGYPSAQAFGSALVSKLISAHATDFHALFGSLCKSMSPELAVNPRSIESSSSMEEMHLADPSDAAKVSNLYFIFTKISNGLMELEALFKGLVDLCHAKNAILVHRCLRILHAVVKHLLSMQRKYKRSAIYSGTLLCMRDCAPLVATFRACMDLNVLILEACFA